MAKSILEEALLQVSQLEEAVKNNAKEILASTMKQEIDELVRESMEEPQEDVEASLEMEPTEELSEEYPHFVKDESLNILYDNRYFLNNSKNINN